MNIRFNKTATGMQLVGKADEIGINVSHLEIKSISVEQAYKEFVKADGDVQ
ncbi:MAG: hypothetical protein ACI8V0_001788 [Pseudohongiellaceae bacterium]